MEVLTVVTVLLVAQAAKIREHAWAREDHTHWAHRPWISGLHVLNGFHLASFLSGWPVWCMALWLAISPLSAEGAAVWLGGGMGSMVVWWQGKRATGKEWDFWWVQAFKRWRKRNAG